jgi:hypothetical protein
LRIYRILTDNNNTTNRDMDELIEKLKKETEGMSPEEKMLALMLALATANK